jgi:hypothetical protein
LRILGRKERSEEEEIRGDGRKKRRVRYNNSIGYNNSNV